MGCTYSVTMTQVVDDLKLKLQPLQEVSEIIQASGQPLKLLGSSRNQQRNFNLHSIPQEAEFTASDFSIGINRQFFRKKSY